MANSLLEKLGLKPLAQSLAPAGQGSLGASAQPQSRMAPGGVEARGPGGPTSGDTSVASDGPLKVVSIVVMAPSPLMASEQRMPLTAMARDSNGDTLDVTMSVEWSSSDPDIVSVDALGVALAFPVSAAENVTITATDPDTGVAGEAVLGVGRRYGPELAPPLKSIEVFPLGARMQVADVLRFTAIGTFGDGAKRPVTTDVDWVSSDRKALDFPPITDPGGAYAFSAGTAQVVAKSRKPNPAVSSNAVAVTVVARPPPPVPRKWLEKVEIAPAQTSLAWNVGEVHRLEATGTWSDKSTQKVTAKVYWHSETPTILAVDKPGEIRVLAAGHGLFVANWSDAIGYSSSPIATYFSVTAYGAEPKTKPKLPPAAPLRKAAALLLIKNLVELAGFRYEGKPGGAFKTQPTGQGDLDALLRVVADMVRQWGELETILAARQIWKAVLPRLQALLKEAAGPKIGLEDKELNPGREAVNAMDAWVKREPGNRVIESSYLNKLTPFGELSIDLRYLEGQHGEDVVAMLKEYEETRSLRTKLTAQLRDLDQKEQNVQKAVKAGGGVEKEVKAHPNVKAEDRAHDLRSAGRDLNLVALEFKKIEENVSNAQVHLQMANNDLKAVEADEWVTRAREAAEKSEKGMDLGFALMKSGAAIMKHGAAGAIELFDVAKDLRSLLFPTAAEQELHRAIEAAAHAHRHAAETALRQMEVEMQQAFVHLDAIKKLQSEFSEDFELERAETEDFYDKTGGKFKFADVGVVIAAANSVREFASKHAEMSARVNRAATYFSRQVDHFDHVRFEGGNKEILVSVAGDAKRLNQAAESDAQRSLAIAGRTRELRTAAHDALYRSKDPRKKSGSKGATP